MFITITYNIFYVPFSISFSYDWDITLFQIVDLLSILIYVIDSYVKANTIVYNGKENKWITDENKLILNYFDYYFFQDLMSFIPFDYLFLWIINTDRTLAR